MNPKQQLDAYQVLPKKSLGQNFLHDPNALEKVVNSAEVTRDDVVLEVGAGTGALTEVLARRARRVIAVEVDERLAPILRERLSGFPNITLVYDDILSVHIPSLMGDAPYLVVANVPYYISSAILRHLLENRRPPRRLVLTMQLEVAEKLIAQPGDLSLLAVMTAYFAKARLVTRFPPAVFYPRPEVSSAVVRLDVYDQPPVDAPREAFQEVVRAGFSQKRKQLKNSLGSGLNIGTGAATALLARAGLDPQRRPETLTLGEWAALARAHAAGTS